jgi:hypothetical protein
MKRSLVPYVYTAVNNQPQPYVFRIRDNITNNTPQPNTLHIYPVRAHQPNHYGAVQSREPERHHPDDLQLRIRVGRASFRTCHRRK